MPAIRRAWHRRAVEKTDGCTPDVTALGVSTLPARDVPGFDLRPGTTIRKTGVIAHVSCFTPVPAGA